MIHVMDFEGNIIDYISESDNAVTHAVHKRDINDRLETFVFRILSKRSESMQRRNRIIIQDKNGLYREFIIDHISQDIDGYTEIETVASYLEDITKAKPYAPGKLEKMTTRQALSDVLKDTGWIASDMTEYGGTKTTSWSSYQTRYEVLIQLCTTYDMMVDFFIELGSNKVDNRYVVLKKRTPLFKGKEIAYGKDLVGLQRVVDFNDVKTALLCLGPERDDGSRLELVVKDDEAQSRIGLPGRYNWGIYEPESDDSKMSESRLRTLGNTELNKRKKEAITYEVTALDIQKQFKHEIVNLGDLVRIKNRDFTPPLYVEAEAISEEFNLISKNVTYGFGQYVEYKESDLRSEFTKKLDSIRQKLNDGLTNVNTIVADVVEGKLEYFERKIFKGEEPPESPVNDMLWLDTRNPDVAVLRRYWNGQWINATAEKAKDIGAITREQALYSELNNTFVNLSIQHSKLLNEMHEVVNSEYLVDSDLKNELNIKLNATIEVFNSIKSNLESMNEETATIGKLIDTQSLFLKYRATMQSLYNLIENAKVAINERFKLLQSQYTDQKFNEVMNKIGESINGYWDEHKGQLLADLPNKDDLEKLRESLISQQKQNLAIQDERIESLQKDIKNYDDGIELVIKKAVQEISANRNLYRYSTPAVFKEAEYYKADLIVLDEDKSIQYNEKTSVNFGSLNYHKWEPNEKYTFSFTIKTDTDNVSISQLNDGYYNHTSDLKLPKDVWVRKSITFTPTYYLADNGITLNLSVTNNGAWYSSWIGSAPKMGKVWIKEFQLEKGEIDSGQKLNSDDQSAIYENITTKVSENSTKISTFEDKISLKADKSEITQTLDEKLEPINNKVDKQESEIRLLPEKIIETVSKKIYDTTISGLVKKIETEESERLTLSNRIKDSVTMTEYHSGIEEAKAHVDDKLKDIANDPEIKESIRRANEEAQQSLKSYIDAQDNLKQIELQAYADGKISDEEQRAIGDAEAKLEEAKKVAEFKANQAERKANEYTDQKVKTETDTINKKVNRYGTQILQNGKDIQLRATKEEFNATRRTLSNVITEIVQNITDGTTINFDDNGTSQSLNVGPEGVKINADKINLRANREFNLLVSDLEKKADETNIINKINLSNEGLNINVNKVGLHGGSGTEYLKINNDLIEMSGNFTRTWQGRTEKDFVFTRLKDGLLRFRNNSKNRSLYYSDFGISTFIDGNTDEASGTLQFFDEQYGNSRGVTLHSYGGTVALKSERNRIVLDSYLTANIESSQFSVYIRPFRDTRPGLNEFSFQVKDADSSGETDGVLLYGNISDQNSNYGSGIRFTKSRSKNIVYITNDKGEIGTGDISVSNAEIREHIRTIGMMEVRQWSNSRAFNQIKVGAVNTTNSVVMASHSGSHAYYGVGHNELRVTDNNGANGGRPNYQNVRAHTFYGAVSPNSSEKFKTNIENWNVNATQIIRDIKIYEYNYKYDLRNNIHKKKHGVILERETPEHIKGEDSIDLYELVSTNTKALQEQIRRNDLLEEKIKKMEGKFNG